MTGQNRSSIRRARVELTSKQAEVARTKEMILSLYEQGHTVEDACKMAGKQPKIWQYYKRTDEEFRDRANLILATRRGARKARPDDIDFEGFCERYLGHKLFRHQLQWIDLIEGREPRDLHPNQTYSPGDPDYVVVNTPPGHAKSTTITMDYVTYKIVTNPNFRVVIVSKTERMAKKFLQGIKRRLTNPKFRELIADYAPAEGFEKSAEVWSSTMIYFGHSDTDQKDPNVEALGVGQQIYGSRADLIILDDIEDVHNAHQFEDHIDWIIQDVISRDAPIICVGTRVAPLDVYSELLNPDRYEGETSDWTYLSQPVILDNTADDPAEWTTLWPKSDIPHAVHPGKQDADGLWSKWDGPRLEKLRRKIPPKTWALVYMQQPVHEDSIFTMEAIKGSQSARALGRLRAGEGSLPTDVSRFIIVAGLDPATAGCTAAVALAVDRETGKRYLLDCFNKAGVTPTALRNLIMEWTERLGIHEWRVERNGFQAFLTQDREITQYLASRGVRLLEHQTTGKNKWDPAWGVASMEMLFRGYSDKTQLLDLPGLAPSEALRTLYEQLITWYPDHPKDQKTDLVMALWFAELGCRDKTKETSPLQSHLDNPFLSENDRMNRVVIDIDDYLREQRAAF